MNRGLSGRTRNSRTCPLRLPRRRLPWFPSASRLVPSCSASCRTPFVLGGTSASDLRRSILSTKTSYVRLIDLLSTCWAVGVPVVHLRVFPFSQKRMAGIGDEYRNAAAILLGKDFEFPPHIAFYLAHEIGHVALGHVPNNSAIVDLEEPDDKPVSGDDEEEMAAVRYALGLLTGSPEPAVLPESTSHNASELARVSLRVSKEVGIEPGTLALCFGYSPTIGQRQTPQCEVSIASENLFGEKLIESR